MTADPFTPSPTINTAACIAPSEFNIKSSSNHTNMVCKEAQIKLLSPSNATENLNPNVNQGSGKRKITSVPKTGLVDQSDVSCNEPKHLAGQSCADFNLISPPRKLICGSRRCASKNRDCAVPASVSPKKFLVSRGGDCAQEAPKPCKCCLRASNEGNSTSNEQTAIMKPSNCTCSHDSQLRRWSSDDKDCKSLAEGTIPSPFSLPSKTYSRAGANASHSSRGDVFTQVSTNVAHCLPALETARHEDSPNLQARHGSIQSQNVRSEENNASEESHLSPITGESFGGALAEDQEAAAVSPSPEKTGNWRLNAVLEAFGSLSPTREGRVKTLVRAFESLLSVKEKGDHQAGTKPRSYPLQFSYLSSNRKESSNERREEDGRRTGYEEDEVAATQQWQEHDTTYALAEEVAHTEWDAADEPWERQDADHIQNHQEHLTDGGSIDKKDDIGNEKPWPCREVPARRHSQLVGYEQASHFKVLKEEKTKPERHQNREEDIQQKLPSGSGTASNHLLQEYVSVPQEKQPTNPKPRTEFPRYSLQRFSVDGHFSNTAARKKVHNKSQKPSTGSNCAISSSRPPLAHKTQMQPAHKKPQVSKPQPFKLLTQERGYMKEQEFLARLKKLIEEEEKLRIPLAQGLPWTTDEPEIPHKPAAKENTKPLDVHLNSELRALERAEFDHFIAEKLIHIEERRMEEERLRQIAEEEEVKRMRQEMVPKAQLMPYFDRPFRPRRSSKRPTIPKEPQFQLNNKQSKRQKCVSSSIC